MAEREKMITLRAVVVYEEERMGQRAAMLSLSKTLRKIWWYRVPQNSAREREDRGFETMGGHDVGDEPKPTAVAETAAYGIVRYRMVVTHTVNATASWSGMESRVVIGLVLALFHE